MRGNEWLKAWGWVATLLIAPVGIVIAVVLLARGEHKSGSWMLAIGLLWLVVAVPLVTSSP